jgi:hypothetical protein
MRTSIRAASMVVAGVLLLTAAAVAQESSADDPVVPELTGLAWHQSVDQTGTEIEATAAADEVDAWRSMLDDAAGSFSDFDYAFYDAYDPATLPRLGSLATVRVAGAETDALRAAVIADIVAQAVALDAEPPTPEPTTLAGRDVAVMSLPEQMGFETAIVYANGDTAWVLLMPLEDAAQAIEQLP